MIKKIVIFTVVLGLLLTSMFAGVPAKRVAADSQNLYQTGVFGIMPEQYVGAFTLELANTYEDDFKSNYSYPMQGMTFTKDGDLVICDTSYGRIHVFSNNLTGLFTFGSLGKGPGKLQYPADVAVDSDGNFYVADFFNDYWAKFDKNGNWILNAGKEGIDDGDLNGPSGIAVENGKVYVSDQLNSRIAVFTTDGKFVKNIEVDGLDNPGGMCVDNSGNILVVGMNSCKVYKLSPDGKLLGSFGDKGAENGKFVLPFDVTTDAKGNIYVVDRGLSSSPHPVVEEFDNSGKFIQNFGSRATKYPQPNGSFFTPAGVAVNSDGNVFVIDAGYFHQPSNPFGYPMGVRLTEFANNGNFLKKIDFSVIAKGRLMNPMSADTDSKGNLWVASWGNFADAGEVDIFTQQGKFVKRIRGVSASEHFTAMGGLVADRSNKCVYVAEEHYVAKFDENGNFLKKIGEGKISNVFQITLDSKGNLWCASNGTQTVAEFKPDGTFVKQFNTPHAPVGIAVDSKGNVYTTTTDDNMVYVFDNDGNEIRSFGGHGRDVGKFWIPYGIAIDSKGEILVADTENGRIQAFDNTGKLLWHTDRFLYEPVGMNFDADGNLLVTDCFHNVVRVLSFKKPVQKDYDFTVESSDSGPQIPAGESESFNLILTNTGAKDDSYTISVKNFLPSGWTLSELPQTLSVKSGKRGFVPVTVTVPKEAKPKDSGYFKVTFVSKGDNTLSKTVTVIVVVPKKPPVTLSFKGDMISVKEATPVSVMLGLAENLYGISVEINYDPTAVSVEKVEPGTALGKGALFMENHKKPGIIYIGYTLSGKASGKTVSGEIAKIYFKGIEEGKTVLAFSDITLENADGQTINSEGNNLVIDVVNPVPPKLTVDLTDGATVQDEYLYFNGQTDPGAKVTINGKAVDVGKDGSFIGSVTLSDGPNTITIVATNKYGLSTTKTFTITLQTSTVITLQPNNPMMTVNGVQQEIDPGRGTKPVIIPKWGRTVVPIRAIVEALGGSIGWDGKERKVTINFNDTTIELWIGKPQARVNGEMKWIDPNNHDVKPIIVNGRTMLPLRFVAENLGCTVKWDASTKTITITYTP